MWRFGYIMFCVFISLLAAAYLSPFTQGNKDFLNALVTLFTVFAGFLVASITLIGDPSLTRKGSWRVAESRRAAIEGPLARQRAIFHIYLITLVSLIASMLEIAPEGRGKFVSDVLELWTNRVSISLSTFSILMTFALPQMIIKLQKERVENDVEDRRHNAGSN